MTLKQRQRLLVLLGLVFAIAAPIIILFSQGYLFDFKKFKFVQAGGIFIKSLPEEALIIIKPESGLKEKRIIAKKPVLISSGTLIKNLLPQNYQIEVSPLNNQNLIWQKQMIVEPLIASKATRIVFPIINPEIKTQTLATSTIQLIAQPENNLKTIFFADSEKQIWSYSPENKEPKLWLDLKTIASLSAQEKISRISPSANGKNLLVETSTEKLIILENQTLLGSSYFQVFLKNTKTKLNQLNLVWDKNNDDGLIALSSPAAYFFNLKTGEYWQITSGEIIGLSPGYYLAEDRTVYPLDQLDKEKKILTISKELTLDGFYQIYPLKNNSFLFWEKSGPIILIQPDKDNPGLNSEKVISKKADLLIINNDQTKIAFSESRKLFVYFLDNVFDDLLYQTDELLFLKELSQEPEALYFANHNWHLISAAKDSLTITEIDKREPINSYKIELAGLKKPLFFENNVFYWLDEKNIFGSGKILP
ncbi:MAG: hypothetical protein AB1721_00830 [Patescibacteria group bacterium]